jgi:large subunit ribosomal protein L29
MASIVKLRETSEEDLEEMLENAREELFNLRFQHASARLEDFSRLRKVRREIAQLETVLHMRDLAIGEASRQPDIAGLLDGKEWYAEAYFDYEDSAWTVEFSSDDDDELASATVNLNAKRSKGRRARRTGKRRSQ